MNGLKIVIVSIILSLIAVFASSFHFNYNNSAFSNRCLWFINNSAMLTPSVVANPWNWTDITQGQINGSCPLSEYLCVICFQEEQFIGTTEQKKQQALIVLADWLSDDHSISEVYDGQPIFYSQKVVTVYLRDTP